VLNSLEEERYVVESGLPLLFVEAWKLTTPFLHRVSQVYGAGSEDMDTLTFNSPILLRHLTFSEAKKAPIAEINLARVLEGMKMEMDQVRLSLFLPPLSPVS